MPKTPLRRPAARKQDRSVFAIVAARYNLPYVQPLVRHARREILALEPGARIEVHWAPGSFEIPLLVQLAAARGKYDAILALGVILQGETAHAALIGEAVTAALLDISRKFSLPVIHEVLLLADEKQARARCLGRTRNRGTEAARAAIAAVRAVRNLLAD